MRLQFTFIRRSDLRELSAHASHFHHVRPYIIALNCLDPARSVTPSFIAMAEYPKTYIRARNLTFAPGGPLQIGHVIEKPNQPTKPLHTLSPLPLTTGVTWISNEINRISRNALNGKIWAKLFQGYNVDIGGEHTGDREAHYSTDSIEIVYFKADPTDEEGQALVRDQPKIKDVWDLWPRRPVYLISGFMIAKNLRFSSGDKKRNEGHAEGGMQINEDVALGGNLGASKESDNTDAYGVQDDIIIAYQLHIIKRKGVPGLGRKAGVYVYEPDDGFMGVGDKEEEKEEVATEGAKTDELKESADMYEVDYDEPEELVVGDQKFFIISFDSDNEE